MNAYSFVLGFLFILFLNQELRTIKKFSAILAASDQLNARQLRSQQLKEWLDGQLTSWSGNSLPPCFDYCYQVSLRKYCSLSLDFALTHSQQSLSKLSLLRARDFLCFAYP